MKIADPSSRLREATRLLIRKLGFLEKSGATCCNTTLTQCHTIIETGRKREISVNELAQLLDLDKSTVSRTVDQLVNSNVIMREVDPKDRRYVTLKLTMQGEEIFNSIEKRMEKYFSEVIASLPEGKQEQVIESLQLLSSVLK